MNVGISLAVTLQGPLPFYGCVFLSTSFDLSDFSKGKAKIYKFPKGVLCRHLIFIFLIFLSTDLTIVGVGVLNGMALCMEQLV